MDKRVRPDYSAPLKAGEAGEYSLSPRYDWIRVFPWINFAVINVITEEGVAQLFVTGETAQSVQEASGIPLVELEWITDTDYEKYLDVQANGMESWLDET